MCTSGPLLPFSNCSTRFAISSPSKVELFFSVPFLSSFVGYTPPPLYPPLYICYCYVRFLCPAPLELRGEEVFRRRLARQLIAAALAAASCHRRRTGEVPVQGTASGAESVEWEHAAAWDRITCECQEYRL